jgi:hypothetical protein
LQLDLSQAVLLAVIENLGNRRVILVPQGTHGRPHRLGIEAAIVPCRKGPAAFLHHRGIQPLELGFLLVGQA